MRLLLSCVVATLMCTESFTQPTTSTQSATGGNDFSLFLKLTGHAFTSPLRWNGCDWLTAGGVVVGTGVGSLLDDEGFRLMERNQTSFNTDLSDITSKYGSGITGIAVTGGFYCAGWAFDNVWLRETGVLMASALSASVVTESALKLIIGRARPYTSLGTTTFKPFNGKADFSSFPSGHAVVAFTLSTVLSERIKNTWASIGLYSLATMVAASRMYTRDHWFSDVVFAGALSTFVARSVVHYYENGMTENDDATGLHIIPQSNGVMVVWRF
ncbi:MAG: phosphatase PAP2 family protein [Bacteroidota bacterium]